MEASPGKGGGHLLRVVVSCCTMACDYTSGHVHRCEIYELGAKCLLLLGEGPKSASAAATLEKHLHHGHTSDWAAMCKRARLCSRAKLGCCMLERGEH